jgi:hypothetical protein
VRSPLARNLCANVVARPGRNLVIKKSGSRLHIPHLPIDRNSLRRLRQWIVEAPVTRPDQPARRLTDPRWQVQRTTALERP